MLHKTGRKIVDICSTTVHVREQHPAAYSQSMNVLAVAYTIRHRLIVVLAAANYKHDATA
jgi:hypothetical protein